MLQIIDQRWRQHLLEMDYLREGIHLRGIAQTDPLVAWQREGFEMFGQLMEAIDDDYVRFITTCSSSTSRRPPPDYSQASYAAADEPVQELGGTAAALARQPRHRRAAERPTARRGAGRRRDGDAPAAAGLGQPNGRAAAPTQTKQKVGRNEPCWCGSGKKFKLCHGAN